MSDRSRGNQFELEVKRMYEAKGWLVERALAKLVWIPHRRVPISQSHDFFGKWDLIAIKKDYPPHWIQVSTMNELSKKRHQVGSTPWPGSAGIGFIYARVHGTGGKKPFYKVYSSIANYMIHTIELIPSKEKK